MNYAVEVDGGGIRLLMANGDRLLVKLVIGNVGKTGVLPDGGHMYNVQSSTAVFLIPRDDSDEGGTKTVVPPRVAAR